jgi:hypothetical protein
MSGCSENQHPAGIVIRSNQSWPSTNEYGNKYKHKSETVENERKKYKR